MKQYQDLLRTILEDGVWQENRTEYDAKFIPSYQITHDLRNGFPVLTTKKLYYKSSIGEILGFLRGVDNAAEFRKLGCKFWDSDANENAKWLNSPWRKGEDDVGLIYGRTWRNRTVYEVSRDDKMSGALEKDGYSLYSYDDNNLEVFVKKIDQLHDCIETIVNRPTDRRIIMHAWFPELFSRMALPPCHVLYEFVPDVQNKVLHMTCFQRSCDTLLGVPMNIFGGSLLLAIIAKACGYTAGQFTHQMTNVHLYENQIDNAKLQIEREPYDLPALNINKECNANTADDILKYIESLEPSDFEVVGYEHHPALPKVKMAQQLTA